MSLPLVRLGLHSTLFGNVQSERGVVVGIVGQVTVGASFLSQTIALQDSTTVKFEIWDTAGQERSGL